jgi:hypothetical protein
MDGTGSPCLWVRNNLMPYHPAPSRPFGISGLVGFCDLISGLLSVRGKILSYHEFILECHFCELYCPYLILQYGPLKSSSIGVVDSEVRCHSLRSWQPPRGNHSKTGNFFSDKHLCGNLKVLRQRPDVFHDNGRFRFKISEISALCLKIASRSFCRRRLAAMSSFNTSTASALDFSGKVLSSYSSISRLSSSQYRCSA